MRTRLVTGAVVAASAALLAGQALAAPASVDITSASLSGTTATATGTAVFDAAAISGAVGGTPTTGAPNPSAFAPAGVDLKSASITSTPTGNGLRFTWKLGSLPAAVPPEGVRYTWGFQAGDKTYQLQAKRSNLGAITLADDPAGHVTSAASGAFQLRGNCRASVDEGGAVPVSNCPHLTFLSGAFDIAKGEVRIDLPFGTAAAPTVKPGAVLTPILTAGMSITAGFQAAVSNTIVSTYINDWNPYIAGKAVQVATGFTDEDPATLAYTTATLAENGTFTGTAPAENGEDLVAVRACEGTTCVYDTAPLG